MSPKSLPQLYRTIAQEALLGFVVFDNRGRCLFINTQAEQLLGTDKPGLPDLVPESERPPFKRFGPELLKHDGLYQDIVVRNLQGSFVANVGIKRFAVKAKKAVLIMLQDVTLQKKLQREITIKQNEIKATFEEILKQNQQLKALDNAKNRFIALTTHELRTPLAAIFASAERLKLKLYDTPEQMDEFIEMIYDQSKHLQELVNDILDFTKIHAGKMDFFIEQHDVLPFTEAVLKNFEGMAENAKVKLIFEATTTPLTCYFDDIRLRQVLANIVNNAIKYNRQHGSVRVHFQENPDRVKVFVTDTGKGIASDQFDKVFNEFETIGNVAQHHKGTGLGMPISKKLMEGMGGKLLLESSEGVGSTFWVEIPKHKILDPSLYQKRPGGSSGDLAA